MKEELRKLGLTVETIDLGEVKIAETPSQKEITGIKERLEKNGFELIENSKHRIIDQIKSLIIKRIHQTETIADNKKFSEFLKSEIGKDYSFLSKLFSSVEGVTIEHYIILQKIEKVKELLKYGDLTLSEIAYRLGYKSVNHLSNQFKKHTGMTATEFKRNTSLKRKPLDKII
ncbi:MAG: AraC family transcriptional regulator [Melioribacteraceae bacterium]|nr:AraC family transcriptional regulator [Melioribacteraceae bacterium]